MSEQVNLPSGWKLTTLGEIADVIGGGTPKTNIPEYFEGGTIPWITPADLSGYTNKHISHGGRFITEEGLKYSSARLMPAGTILFTSRAPVGYVAIAANPVCTNQGFKSFVLKEGILPDYVYWYLKGSKELAESMASGTTFLELSGAKAKQIPIPLAPPEDQQRIVAEIEKQFSHLDEAVASLKRIQANLKRYKAAVLKAAVEGKLTEQWRKEHPAVEPAEQLLKRILAERRVKWETEELAKMKEKGSVGAKHASPNSWKKKYKEPEILTNVTGSFGCLSASVGSVCEIVDGDRGENYPQKTDFKNDGYCLFLSTKNVRPDGFLFKEMQFIDKEKHERLRKGLLERGDIVFTSRGTLGNIAHYVDSIPYDCVRINSGMFIIREFSEFMIEKYFDYYLKSPAVRIQIDKLQSGTAQPQLPIREFKSFEVKFPSKAEQELIVQEIDRRLSVTEELETTIETNLKRSERLRQTILQRAFSGGLA